MKKVYITLFIFLLSSPLYAGVNIDLDKTVFIQFAIFVVFGLIAQRLIITPIVNIIDKREEKTDDSIGESKEMKEELSDLEKKYYSKIKNIRKEISEEYRNSVEIRQKENRKLIEEKRVEVNKKLDVFVEDIDQEKKDSRRILDKDLDLIVDSIVKKVLN